MGLMKTGYIENDGPNCFNATMVYFHKNESWRFVDDLEINDWLFKHTDQVSFEELKLNDIIVFYNLYGQISHTCVVVDMQPDILCYHKLGYMNRWPYKIESLEDIFVDYGRNIQVRRMK